jgi:hypothetical protein
MAAANVAPGTAAIAAICAASVVQIRKSLP